MYRVNTCNNRNLDAEFLDILIPYGPTVCDLCCIIVKHVFVSFGPFGYRFWVIYYFECYRCINFILCHISIRVVL